MQKDDIHREIAILGMGFGGLMTALQLVKGAQKPMTLYLISHQYPMGKGVAYSTPNVHHLLNVPAARMSCLPEEPDHLVEWAMKQTAYKDMDGDAVGKAFLPRGEYGRYLTETWQEVLNNKRTDTTIHSIEDCATAIDKANGIYTISTQNGKTITASHIVLATGNELPKNIAIPNNGFYQSPNYIKNPWYIDGVRIKNKGGDVLLLGNSLTMIDSVISLMESGFGGKIHTLSPHGFTVLPHRDLYIPYTKMVEELRAPYQLHELFSSFKKHARLLAKDGITVEPLVDSLRPYTQAIWAGLSITDKRQFLRHLRNRWNKARHRVADEVYEYINDLQVRGKLHIYMGNLIDIVEQGDSISIRYLDKVLKTESRLQVGTVINCTGPSLDISQSENPIIQDLVRKGYIKADALKIGIDATPNGAVIDAGNNVSNSIYTIGGNLRGVLWETTAVPEIRGQAAAIAKRLHHL